MIGKDPHYFFEVLDKIYTSIYLNGEFVDTFFEMPMGQVARYYDLPIKNFAGNTTVMLVVDPDDYIKEENEENNKFTFYIINDLAVMNLSVSYLNETSMKISWEIENNGDITNQNIEYQVLLNDRSEEYGNISFLLGKLNPESEISGRKKKFEITKNISGFNKSINVSIVIDPNNRIPEINKENNVALAEFKIQQKEILNEDQKPKKMTSTPHILGFEAILLILVIGIIYYRIRTKGSR